MDKNNISTKSAIVANSFWNFASTTIKTLVGIFSSVLIARTLGPTMFGSYSYINYVAGTAVFLSGLGFPLMIIKYVSEYSGKDRPDIIKGILRFVLKIEIIATIIVFLLTLLFALKLIKFQYPIWFILGAFAIFPLSFGWIYGAAIRGIQ